MVFICSISFALVTKLTSLSLSCPTIIVTEQYSPFAFSSDITPLISANLVCFSFLFSNSNTKN